MRQIIDSEKYCGWPLICDKYYFNQLILIKIKYFKTMNLPESESSSIKQPSHEIKANSKTGP
jgi:hypothetical protein